MRTAKKSKTQLCACHDNPDMSATEVQRYDLADALVSVYQKHLTQQELVTAAVRKVKEMKPRCLPPRA